MERYDPETQTGKVNKVRSRSPLLLALLVLLPISVIACTGPPPTANEFLVIDSLATDELLSHQGEVKIVEGVVAMGYYADDLEGEPTFLDFHDPPEGYFKAIIWGDNRDEFPPSPETHYLGKKVRVKGLIETYRGAPEILLREPSQIWFVEYDNAVVARVIDGDTIEMEDGHLVRYIGIDAPERGEPYYWEARWANNNLVAGKQVRLEKDVTGKDRYGRLLRYVWIGDTMVNAELVKHGYAYSYSYDPNLRYQEHLLRLEKEAREQRWGLWNSYLF
jgi:endonuclease YncB( thermonuclease family)